MDFIGEIETRLGIEAKNMMSIQPGDVPNTWAEVEDLVKYINYRPETCIESCIAQFIDWYKSCYDIKVAD